MTVTGGEDNNYNIIYSYKEGRDYAIVNIAKVPLIITADDKSINYLEKIPQFTISYEGFVNNDSEAGLYELPRINCDVTNGTEPGTYKITLSGGHDNNYEYTLISGTIVIIDTTGIYDIESDLEKNIVYDLNGLRITEIENLTENVN